MKGAWNLDEPGAHRFNIWWSDRIECISFTIKMFLSSWNFRLVLSSEEYKMQMRL